MEEVFAVALRSSPGARSGRWFAREGLCVVVGGPMAPFIPRCSYALGLFG